MFTLANCCLVPTISERRRGEKDIDIEQCYICGIIGYNNFLSLDRLSTFLGWQLSLGCYGENASNQGDMLQEDWNNSEDSHQGLVDNVHSSGLYASRSRCQTNRLNGHKLPRQNAQVPP